MVIYFEFYQDIQEPSIDWDIATDHTGETAGAIIVPDVDCDISSEKLAYAQSIIDQSDVPAKELYLLCREIFVWN